MNTISPTSNLYNNPKLEVDGSHRPTSRKETFILRNFEFIEDPIGITARQEIELKDLNLNLLVSFTNEMAGSSREKLAARHLYGKKVTIIVEDEEEPEIDKYKVNRRFDLY